MNLFVNPSKRSISLPSGCKDLVDVLRRSEQEHDSTIRKFICLVLLQAQQDGVEELVFGVSQASGDAVIKCKVAGIWQEMQPFPSGIRSSIITELPRMAGIPEGRFPTMVS